MDQVIRAIDQEADTAAERLMEWLRIPSVSTDSARAKDVRAAGEFVLDELRTAGFEARMTDTPGHPVVTAEWLGAPGAPTVLIYGHYDVQPPEPLDLWRHGPFEPTIEGRNLVARGATDDKGQAYALVRGVATYLRVAGKLPVNVKFLLEGEEEIGSPNLTPFIQSHRDALSADIAVISDCSQFGPGVPAITVGLKGLCYVEIRVDGPNRDLHSGSFGGAVANPGNALCWMIGQLRDAEGRVTIPGFYDDVVELTPADRESMAALPFDEEHFRRDLGVDELVGEAGYTTVERKGARPTLDVNGLLCGFTGEGAKTVLPSHAMAKFSMRLVPDQSSARIAALVTKHLEGLCPAGCRVRVNVHHGAEPILVPFQSDFMKAAHRAVAKGFGKEPVYMREGGSIPVVSTMKNELGIDTILLGLGLPDDNAHSPNEKFDLDDFQRGIRTMAYLMDELAG
ncbi:MAG: dipeptidase [Planctomycetes bacterium]|nr:dipeptidase [Planctomycetota bacterium]